MQVAPLANICVIFAKELINFRVSLCLQVVSNLVRALGITVGNFGSQLGNHNFNNSDALLAHLIAYSLRKVLLVDLIILFKGCLGNGQVHLTVAEVRRLS